MLEKIILHTVKIKEDHNMAENLFAAANQNRETVCIDTYRVLDSCRDRDCFRDTKCYLTPCGQEIIERTENVRAKWAKVVSAYIDIDDVPFNCGFYQLNTKIFVKLICEGCLGGGSVQDFESLCVLEKKVVLYGGEGSVSVFKSNCGCNAFCPDITEESCKAGDTMPTAAIETVDPVVLDIKVRQAGQCGCGCGCSAADIPQSVMRYMGGNIVDGDRPKYLTASLGLFSVMRIIRPAQLLVSAAEYNVPEKQCVETTDDDPCTIFNGIPFPEKEFNASLCKNMPRNGRCGCSG